MTIWKTAALAAALAGAAGAGASLSPVAHGQTAHVVAPRAVEFFGGSGARIGISIVDVDPSDTKAGQAGGVVVDDVVEDGPAAKAGVKKGDVIVEFDGERVRSARQFTRLVQETNPGRKVQAIVLRDGQRTPLTVEPRENDSMSVFRDGRLFDEFARIPTPPIPARPARPVAPTAPRFYSELDNFLVYAGSSLGITTSELSTQLGDYFGTKDGALVTAVSIDSAAAKAGLRAGDVITSFNGEGVARPSDFRRHAQRLSSGDEFTIGVIRDKKAMTLKGKVEERRERRRTFRSTI